MFRQPTKVCTADYDSGVQYFIFAVLSEEARRLILVESAYNLRYAASTCICAARCLVLAVSAYTTLAGVVSERARCLSSPVSCPSAQDVWAARRPTLSGVQDCIKYVVFATMSEQPNVLSLPCPAITLVCRIASTCCLRHPGHLPGLDAYTYALHVLRQLKNWCTHRDFPDRIVLSRLRLIMGFVKLGLASHVLLLVNR